MTKLQLAILFAAFTISCSPKRDKDPEQAPTEIGDTIVPDVARNARNSLDYIGLYKGSFPASNCPDTEVTLELSEEFNYIMTFLHKCEKESKVEVRGTFRWDERGHGIILSDKKHLPNEFVVSDKKLVSRTDTDGNLLKGKQLDGYTLVKLSEAAAMKTDESAEDKIPPQITGIHWKLTEVDGRPIAQSSNRDYFIQFTTDGRFTAFAGCNQMGGKYEIRKSNVQLHDIIATRMACADMKIETAFIKHLEAADNFVANAEIFQLRKDGRNLLKFEAATTVKK